MLSHDRKEPWKNILTRLEKQNIHAMNKRAVSRNSEDMWKHIGKVLNV
jgi:hypothetical protein